MVVHMAICLLVGMPLAPTYAMHCNSGGMVSPRIVLANCSAHLQVLKCEQEQELAHICKAQVIMNYRRKKCTELL